MSAFHNRRYSFERAPVSESSPRILIALYFALIADHALILPSPTRFLLWIFVPYLMITYSKCQADVLGCCSSNLMFLQTFTEFLLSLLYAKTAARLVLKLFLSLSHMFEFLNT